MKTILAVVVYDRFDNIKQWVRCWDQIDHPDSELVIIHNYESDQSRDAFQLFCNNSGITYVSRKNIGYDVGAFQDVCRERLEGFPTEFDNLLWCVDDLYPMRRGLIEEFTQKLIEGVSAVCYEVSMEVRPHIRTTGFMIRKSDLSKIQFPADPITDKRQCYQFEHLAGNTLYNQMQALGTIVQVCDVDYSCLWDTGHRAKAAIAREARRKNEFRHAFPTKKENVNEPLVTCICPVYNSFPEIIGGMINQSHKNWELKLMHDGPNSTGLRKLVDHINDPRITFTESEQHQGRWGHYLRKQGLEELDDKSEYVFITNADNHHPPVFIERMLSGFTPEAVATYCSDMIHSYTNWRNISCRMRQGYVDMAGVLVRSKIAKEIGFKNIDAHSADFLYFQEIGNKYSFNNFKRVEGTLLIHN